MAAAGPDIAHRGSDDAIVRPLIRTHYVWFVALIALMLRVFYLDHQSLWYDEGFALSLSDGTPSENLAGLLGTESGDRYQLLYYLVLGVWRSVVGDGQLAIRLLSVAAGVGTVVMAFVAARRLFGIRRARWAALIGTVSAFGVFYSQEARPYALAMLLAAVQIYLVGRIATGDAGQSDRWWLALTTAIAAFASVMLVLFTFAITCAHLIAYWDGPGSGRKWWTAWLPSVVGLLPAAVYFGASSALLNPEATEVTRTGAPLIQNALYVAYGIVVGTTFGPPQEALRGLSASRVEVALGYWPALLVLAVSCAAGLWMLMVAIRRSSAIQGAGSRNASFLVLALAFSYSASLLFAVYTGINWLPRHSSFLAVPFWILMPYIVGRAWDGRHVRGSWRAPGTWLVLVLLGMNLWALGNYYFDDDHTRDEYRQVAAHLTSAVEANEVVVLLRGTDRLFEYYPAPPIVDVTDAQPESLRALLTPHLRDGDVWVVLNRPFWWSGDAPPIDTLADVALLDSVTEFPYFEVYRFESLLDR